jgi:diphthamide biosynthesis methyltransferase
MAELISKIKKLGFTDRYLIAASIITGIFGFCCLAVYTFFDKDTILFFTGALGFLGTLAGFVVTKNKTENKAWIENSNSTTPTEETITTTDSNSQG